MVQRLTQLQRWNGIGSKRTGINTVYRDKELIPAGANDISPVVTTGEPDPPPNGENGENGNADTQ